MAGRSNQINMQILLNGTQAVNTLTQIQKAIKSLDKEAKQLTKKGPNQDLIGAENAKKRANELREVLRKTQAEVKNVSSGFSVAGKSVAGLENALKIATQQFRALRNEGDRNKMALRIREIKTELNRMNQQLEVANQNGTAFGRLFQRAAEYTGFYMLLNRSRQIITDAIQGNLKLSDSISDIQKVSGLSEEAVKGLVTEIQKIDSRNAPEVLNNMAYAAGKLGIKGADNLLGFTRAADKLNVALKEYLGDGAEGVVRLMKFANVMGTTEQYGVEQALIKTGSALNYMTQSTAAAADYMIDFAARFGPVARAARMSTGDVIGLASALDALSLNNEMAATSLQKFTVKLLSSPVHVAKALGMDAQAAKEMVETGRSIELVDAALTKLAERSQKYGVSGLTSVIGEIGSKGQAQRLIMTLQSLANNTQMVEQYVAMANQSFKEGTSIINEYNIKNQNAAAIMDRAKNSWQKLMVNSENVGLVKEIAQAFYDMSKSLQQNEVWMGSLKISLKILFNLLQAIVQILPSLIILLTGLGIGKLVVGIINLTRTLGVLWTSLKVGAASWRTLSLAMKTNVIGILLSLLPLVIDLIVRFTEKTNEAAKSIDRVTAAKTKFDVEINRQKQQIDEILARVKAAKDGSEERARLIRQINSTYGSYLQGQLTEAANNLTIAKSLEEVNKQLSQELAYKMQNQELEGIRSDYGKGQKSGMSLFVNSLISAGASMEQAYKAEATAMELVRKNKGKEGWRNSQEITRNVLQELAKGDSRYNAVWVNRSRTYQDNQGWTHQKKGDELIMPNIYTGLHNFVASYVKEGNLITRTQNLYKPFIGDYTPPQPEPVTTTTLEDFSKEQAAAEAARRSEEAAARKEMELQYKGIKALIEAFYNDRAAVINDMHSHAVEGYKTALERDMRLDENKVLMAEAINSAWKNVLGEEGGADLWQAQLESMRRQVLEGSKELDVDLSAALQRIVQSDMSGLLQLVKNFGTKLQGEMRNTIAKNDKLIAASGSKVWEELEKAIDKHDYEEKVRKKYWDILRQTYLFRTSFEDGIEGGFKDVNEAAAAGIDALAGMFDKLVAIDIHDPKGLETFRQLIAATDVLSDDMAQLKPEYLEQLYYAAYKLGEEMANAKKQYVSFQKRVMETRYKQTDTYTENKQTEEGQSWLNKMTSTGLSKYGLESSTVKQDNEILLYTQKLQSATDYYTFLEQSEADAMLLEEQRQKVMEATIALQDKMAAKMTNMQTWFKDAMNTLPEYGTALGEAFSKTDPEERADAFKQAHKEILKSLGDATKKMILEWVKQRIQHALQQKLMLAEEKSSEADRLTTTITAEQAIATAKETIGQTVLTTQATQSAESLSTEAAETTGKVNLGIAAGAAKTISSLGWWGIPLVAVITALLNGLLSWALGSLFKDKTNSTDTASTDGKMKSTLRLVSGMLTYDEGNIESLPLTLSHRGGTRPYRGDDGRVYHATATAMPEGTALVRHPIATMVNGMPALVAERGPEMIIGRQTLRDMSQFRPDLLQQIVMFEKRRFRTYDEGNLASIPLTPSDRGGTPEQMMVVMEETRAVNAQLVETVAVLTRQLQNGIYAKINKYGAGGLVEEVADGLYATKKRNNNVNVRRLFG